MKRLPNFYKDLVLFGQKHFNLLVQSELNKQSILSQAIFDNKNLLIKGESVWHKLLYSKGVCLCVSFLSCYSLVKTIPKDWRVVLRAFTDTDENLAFENSYDELYRYLSAKFFHKKLISNHFVHPSFGAHLLRKLNIQEVNWRTVYMSQNLGWLNHSLSLMSSPFTNDYQNTHLALF